MQGVITIYTDKNLFNAQKNDKLIGILLLAVCYQSLWINTVVKLYVSTLLWIRCYLLENKCVQVAQHIAIKVA